MTTNENKNPDSQMDDTIEAVNDDGEDLPEVEEEQEPEWQKARHEVGTKNLNAADADHPMSVQTGSTDSVSQKLEDDVVLDYLSDKIYGGPEATIREYEANGETALVRAAKLDLKQNDGWTDDDFQVPREDEPGLTREMYPYEILEASDISPSIEINWYKDDQLLVIQDNGIGFTPREVTDVLAYTGRSGVRDDGSVSGQFGMGFLSFVKATGKKGGMTMFTRTRRTDVPEHAQRSFAMYAELGDYNQAEGELPPGQYGTRFEIPLKDGIQEKHSDRYSDEPVIRKWVKKYSEWMRVPVLYEEFESNETVYDDEYGEKSFAEGFEGAKLEIDRPEFYSVSYPQASGETLLLSMPIERNASSTPSNAPWKADIRFRNENGVVVECESQPELKGQQTVEREEYDNMDADRQDDFAVTGDLPDDAIVTPEPKANRDGLENNSQFWKWLGSQFDEKYKANVREFASELDTVDDIEDLAANRPNDFSFLMVGLANYKGYRNKTVSQLQDQFEGAIDVKLSEEVVERVMLLLESISHAPRGRSNVSKKRNRTSEKLWRLYREVTANDATVYMGVNVNQNRAKVAWASDDHNQVVKVEGTSDYSKFDEIGFEKLKEVPLSKDSDDTDSFEIPDNLGSSASGGKNNAGKAAPDRELTIRKSNGRDNMKSHSVKSIEKVLHHAHRQDGDGLKLSYSTYAKELVLFPSSTDRTMSDHYGLAFDDRAVATCTNMVYDYLQNTPGIMHIDDLISDAKDTSIDTSEGTMTVEEAGDKLLVHVIRDDYLDQFRKDGVMEHMADYLHDKLEDPAESEWNYDEEQYPDEFIYAPVDYEAWKRIQPSTLDQHFIAVGGDIRPRSAGASFAHQLSSDASMYAVARFTDWDGDTAELDAVRQLTLDADEGNAMAVIESLGILHDNGINPFSKQNGEVKLTAETQASLPDATDDKKVRADGGQDD